MKKIRDVDYLYATARLRALEKNMLTARDYDKMLDAGTLEESYKIANDLSLHSRLGATEYETAIGAMLQDTYALVEEVTGGNPIFDLFRYKYDGHNLKVLIKAQAASSDARGVMSPLGAVPPDELMAAYHEQRLQKLPLPERMTAAALEAAETLAKSGDPQAVDILLDKAVLVSMLEQARESGFPFLIRVVRATIDLENLRTAVRLKRMGKDIGLLRRLTVEGGAIEPSRLWDAFAPQGYDALREMLFTTEYFSAVAPLFDTVGDKKPLTAFERGLDNYLVEQLRSTRLVAFGLEPVISYLLAKENEAKQIRIVLASRQAGVSKEKISERLRETYA